MAFTRPIRAFILGAGLGTRLRPLTESLPKPLLPVKGKPLVHHILRRLAAVGIRQAVINTHHAALKWQEVFPGGEAEGVEVFLRHETELLDTGGGLKNVQDLLVMYGTFLIYNGDVWSDLPLQKAIDHHRQARDLVTMVLRSQGGPLQVALDSQNRVVDIRGQLGAVGLKQYLFTGIHVVDPKIFDYLPPLGVQSIIPIYLDFIRRGLRIGGVVIDEGEWSDIGTIAEYERLK